MIDAFYTSKALKQGVQEIHISTNWNVYSEVESCTQTYEVEEDVDVDPDTK